jgi:hypothetical protein
MKGQQMTKLKSKTKAVDVMDNLPTVQHGVEQATSIAGNIGKGESIRKQIKDTAMEWFAPFAEAGADATYLKAYSKNKEKNNLKRYVRDYFVEACAIAVVGRSGLAFLEDKNNSGDAEFTPTEGTLSINPKARSKKYIQQQYGKILFSVGDAIKQAAKDAENGVDGSKPKEKTVNDDMTRFLNALATAQAQTKKGKPDGSIPDTVSTAFATLMESLPDLIKASK